MITLRNTLALAILDFINAKFNEGSAGPARLYLYGGPRPAYPENSHVATLLGTLDLPNPLFKDGNSGPGQAVASAFLENFVEGDVVQTGVVQWYRVTNRAGQAVEDGSVTDSAGNGDLKLQETSLVAGRKFKVTSWITRYPQ